MSGKSFPSFLLTTSRRKFAVRLAKRIKDAEAQSVFPPESPNQMATVIGLGDPEGKRQEAAVQMMQEMLIYYKIARDRYIDNVIIQVVERHLLDSLDEEFSQHWIRDADLFDRVTRDPKHDERRRQRDAVQRKRDNLWDCYETLESLRT